MSDKSANLVLGADISGLLKGYSDAAQAGDTYNKNAKAAVEGLSSTFVKAEEGTMGLMQAHRAAAKSAQELALSTGEFSKETLVATKYAADLSHKLEEWKNIETTFKPGGMSELMGKSMSTATKAAGGLAAGMALVGVEDDKVMKKVMELQSLMMMSEAIKSVGELKNAWIEMSAALEIMAATNPFLLITIGAVALGVAFYALYKYFNEGEGELTEYAKKELEANEASEKFCSTIDKETRALIAKNQELQKEIIAKQRGVSVDQITIENLQRVTDINKSQIATIEQKINLEKLANNPQAVANLEYALKIKNADIEATEKQIQVLKDSIDLKKKDAVSESGAQRLVDELERKKAYQSAFNNWDETSELELLEAEKKTYAAGTKAYKDKANEIDIITKQMENSQKLAFEMNIGYSKTEGVSDAIGKELNKGFSQPKQYSLPITFNAIGDPIAPVKKQVKEGLTDVQKAMKEMSKTLGNTASDTGLSIMKDLGASMGGQKIDWGKEALVSLAEFAGQLGAGLIAVGLAMNVAAPGSGAMQLYGGIALEAAAALVGGYAGTMGTQPSGGETSGGGAAQSTGWNGAGGNAAQTGTNFGTLNATTQISGRNLQIVLNRNNYITGRVK